MSNLFSASRQKFTGSDEPEFFGVGSAARSLPLGVALAYYGGGKGASSSQTVSIPPEIMARYNAVNARAENVAATPFTPYSTDPNAFVAGLTPSQNAGIANINAAQGMATPDVKEGQGLQRQGIQTAVTGQNQANAIDQTALQGISQAQQQGTAYNQAAGQNIFNAMGSAAPYMNQMGQLTQAGLGQGQQYLGGATDLTRQAIATGQQYANQAQPYYTGALQAAQPLNYQAANLTGAALNAAQPMNYAAQNYLTAGAQNVGPGGLDYSQYMNPYMSNVVQAQQALQEQENARQRSAMQGQAIQAGAFGGDRAGIEQANLARQQSLANQATLANLLQSGYGQAQTMAQQQQGVGLAAAQANRAAQQQAAQQAAALGQQQYAQNLGAAQQFGTLGQQQYGQQLGLGQGLAALGQQQYGQALGTGAQINQLGQAGFGQNLQAGAQLGQLGQNLYAQNIGQGQAIQGLGNQQFTQGLQGSQAAAGIGQNIFGNAAQTAGITQAGGMNIGNLGLQNQAAQIAAAQAQMAAGQQQQQTEQAGKTALYNQYLQQQGYPFQTAQFLANIAEGTGALSGSTTTAQRTGQRGGRMGDGYASGGLVPNSQGGVVYEPGLYGRGGFGAGGTPVQWVNTGATNDNGETQYYDPTTNKYQWSSVDPSTASTGTAASAITDAQKAMPFNADAAALAGLDPGIADLYQKELGRTPDASGAKYWQDMLNSGMSMDQIKYNVEHSPEYLRKTGDVDTLKGAPLTYDPSKFAQPAGLTMNQYGSYSAAPPMATGKGPQAPMGYGNMGGGYGGYQQPQYGGRYDQPMGGGYGGYQQPMNYSAMGGYGGYGGGLAGGYGMPQAPSNYGMPNFGSSAQYGGAPDYAGAMQYGTMQSQAGYGMPQFGGFQQQPQYGGYQQQPQFGGYQQQSQYGGYQPQVPAIPQNIMDQYANPSQQQMSPAQNVQYGQFQQQQQMPQATGKGAAPTNGTTIPQGVMDQYASAGSQQAPTATGKGTSSPPPSTGKGPSTGMKAGGRTAFADGGRAGYLGGGQIPGDPYGLTQNAAAMYSGIPYLQAAGGQGGLNIPMGGAAQHQMLQAQKSIMPAQENSLRNAIGVGTSIASLGEAGTKLYDKLKPKTPEKKDGDTTSTNKPQPDNPPLPPINPDRLGGLNPSPASDSLLKFNDTGTADWSGLFNNFAAGGRAGYYGGGIPGLDDLRKGQADTPGGEGSETPLGDVVKQGTQTPSELKSEMDKMGGGGGGLGGGGGSSGIAGAIGTASSILSLGNAAMSAGSWIGSNVLPFLAALLATGGRVGKAGGGGVTTKLVNTRDPRYRQMEIAFNNLLKRYDSNPLLAAAAMDAGVKVVDNAVQQAGQTGKDISDFLPRRTQEYMYALSQAAIGAHKAVTQKQAPAPGLMPRAAGGRTGYALPGFVDDDTATGVAPSDNIQLAGDVPKPDTPETPKYTEEQLNKYRDAAVPHIISTESGGEANARAKTSSAAGLGQFTDDTARTVLKRHPDIAQGIDFNPNARGFTASLPENVQRAMISAHAGDQVKLLAGMGYEPTPQNIKANWVLGEGGGPAFLQGLKENPNQPGYLLAGRDQVAANQNVFFNKDGTPRSAADVYAKINSSGVSGAQPAKPVQVAEAKGLAGGTKTDGPSPWASSIGKILPDAVPTDSSFWVPLIAGLGSMLASNQYRFSQRLGEGLIGGAAAYGKQQEFQQKQQQLAQQTAQNAALLGLKGQELDISKQKLGIEGLTAGANALAKFQTRFQPQFDLNGQIIGYTDLTRGSPITVQQYQKQMQDLQNSIQSTTGGSSAAISAMGAGAAPVTSAVTSAAGAGNQPAPVTVDAPTSSVSGVPAQTINSGPPEVDRTNSDSLKAGIKYATEMAAKTSQNKGVQEIWNNQIKDYQGALNELGNRVHGTSLGSEYWERSGPAPINPAPRAITKDTPRAEIDPNTGVVKLSMPDVGYPLSGGFTPDPHLQRPNVDLKKDGFVATQQAADIPLQKEFEEKANGTREAISAYLKLNAAAKQLQAGGFSTDKSILANQAEGLGLTGISKMIMDAPSVSAAQQALKNGIDTAISKGSDAFTKQTQNEFKIILSQGNPSVDMEPSAYQGIVQQRLAALLWQDRLNAAWQQAKANGVNNFSAFKNQFSALNPTSVFDDQASRILGNSKGTAFPDQQKLISGAVYSMPSDAEVAKSPFLQQLRNKNQLSAGDAFTFEGVQHGQSDAQGKQGFGYARIRKMNPNDVMTDSYKTMLNSSALSYGLGGQ